MSKDPPALLNACRPRWDVLGEDKGVSALAVDLDLISGSLAEKSLYGDAKSFFSITHPTTALRTIPKQVFERITGKNPHGKGIFLLGTALGGGKSHVLAALFHMARLGGRRLPEGARELLGDVDLPQVQAVILTQSSPAGGRQVPRTLWGEIAKQLGHLELMKDFDERLQAPSKESLRQLLQGKPVLILIDELTNYLIRASAVSVGQSSLAVQTRVFLQDLEEVVDQLTNTALVVSQLPEEFEPEHRAAIEKAAKGKKAERAELEEHVKREVGLAAQILLRKAEPVTPVRDDEELVSILRRRVFESVDDDAAKETAESYATYYRSPGVRAALPVTAYSKDYEQKLLRTYPFHPKLISLLRDKLGQAPKFMQTRGALLLTILAVRRLYKEKCQEAMVHPFHVDPREGEIREELSQRVFDEVKLDNAMVTEFIDGPDARARSGTIDDKFGAGLAKYHGGGGEIWDGTSWVLVDKATVERRVKSDMVRVLVATDAASEGLNLQAMDAVMNYDIPWNPMRIEQRIGRIDRLNQLSETVSVHVVLPRGTVEEEVYSRCVERIGLFRESMGPLQPILIEEFITKDVLQGESVAGAVDDAIDQWSAAREHAELLEEALASVLPADEWRASREVERQTLQALAVRAGFRSEGDCLVRGGRRISILQPSEGAEILTAAPSNQIFESLLSELGPVPNELTTGTATYKLIPCRSSFVLAVRPSIKEGWYLVRDLTRLDGRGGLHVGATEADVRAYVENLDGQRSHALRKRQDEQRSQRLGTWQSEAVRSVFAPIVRLSSGDLRKAAEEVMCRDKLSEVMRIYSGSGSELKIEDAIQTLSSMHIELRGPKKNIGLIVRSATELLKKRPRD